MDNFKEVKRKRKHHVLVLVQINGDEWLCSRGCVAGELPSKFIHFTFLALFSNSKFIVPMRSSRIASHIVSNTNSIAMEIEGEKYSKSDSLSYSIHFSLCCTLTERIQLRAWMENIVSLFRTFVVDGNVRAHCIYRTINTTKTETQPKEW